MNPCNPCGMKMHNPCGMKMHNPCGMKMHNPCGAKSAGVDRRKVTRPAGLPLKQGNHTKMVREGKKLFSDTSLSSNGLSCNACHTQHALFKDTFSEAYPHYVKMANEQAGVKKVELDEMVQFCMVVPMASNPLPWDSTKLAALTAYTAELQKTFKPGHAGAMKSMGNPCNPCAMKMKMHNPCNPCGMKKRW
ncbi:MAG: cytochrome c peroxidase [Gammaproteobacteria bacterium]|nr:cytochrome c peroxidase [Gammaproteobacteria bacterium]